MSNKLADLKENVRSIATAQKTGITEMMEEEKKRGPEDLIMRTTSAKCFTISYNTITRSSGEDYSWRMVLLNVVVGEGVFSFRTRLHQLKGGICIGVTDRVTQKERNSAQQEHSIQYGCWGGIIYYATGDDKDKHENSASVSEGMELLCEVEREKCQVTFTVFK
jgi:hypothetical protein